MVLLYVMCDDADADSGNGGFWIEQQKLIASDTTAQDIFGEDVSIDGNTICIGAAGPGASGTYAGSAYMFITESVFADLDGDHDVDAADLHLVIPPAIKQQEDFKGGRIASIDSGCAPADSHTRTAGPREPFRTTPATRPGQVQQLRCISFGRGWLPARSPCDQ